MVVVVVCGWGDGWRNGREKDLDRSFSKTVDFDRWRPFLENGWVVNALPNITLTGATVDRFETV